MLHSSLSDVAIRPRIPPQLAGPFFVTAKSLIKLLNLTDTRKLYPLVNAESINGRVLLDRDRNNWTAADIPRQSVGQAL
jgi:hypothetical protein